MTDIKQLIRRILRPQSRFEDWFVSEKGGPGSGNFNHSGRPGQVGGSAPGGGAGAFGGGVVPSRMMDTYESDALAREIRHKAKMMVGADNSGQMKDKVISKLSDLAGCDYDDVNIFIKSWASTSNDSDLRALNIQVDAAEELGIELSDWQKKRIAETNSKYYYNGKYIGVDPERILPKDAQKRLIREMYNLTQERLKQVGYDPDGTIILYRGMKTSSAPLFEKDGTADYVGNAIESWTLDRDTADGFALGGRFGALIGIEVPVKNIIGTYFSGFGCMNEHEFVIGGLSGAGNQVQVEYLIAEKAFYGHAGRPGQVGGSVPSHQAMSRTTGAAAVARMRGKPGSQISAANPDAPEPLKAAPKPEPEAVAKPDPAAAKKAEVQAVMDKVKGIVDGKAGVEAEMRQKHADLKKEKFALIEKRDDVDAKIEEMKAKHEEGSADLVEELNVSLEKWYKGEITKQEMDAKRKEIDERNKARMAENEAEINPLKDEYDQLTDKILKKGGEMLGVMSLANIDKSPEIMQALAVTDGANLTTRVFDRNGHLINDSMLNRDGDEADKFYNTIMSKSVLDGEVVPMLYDPSVSDGRSYFLPSANGGNGGITLAQKNPVAMIHETAHWIEHYNPAVNEKCQEFLARRAKESGETKPKPLGAPYEPQDVAFFDKFTNPYSGMDYSVFDSPKHPGGGWHFYFPTEILSTGVTFMYKDPIKFYMDDPDFFEFVVSTLRGV